MTNGGSAGWRRLVSGRVGSVVLVVVVVALVIRALLRPPIDLQVYVLGGSMVMAAAMTCTGLRR
jgi:hypothetical protein